MNDIIQFITGGADTFTPSVMVGLIVFLMISDGLFTLVSSAIKGVRKR